jgi:hypothetical protein
MAAIEVLISSGTLAVVADRSRVEDESQILPKAPS